MGHACNICNKHTMVGNFFERLNEVLGDTNRKQRAAARRSLEAKFEAFLAETQPLVPIAQKHPQAALYRHAWKRAKVLQLICQGVPDPKRVAVFSELADLTAVERVAAMAGTKQAAVFSKLADPATKYHYETVLQLVDQCVPDPERATVFSELAYLAAKHYDEVAPDGPYGKVPLQMEPKAVARLLQKEIRRLRPLEPAPPRPLSCIYIGTDEHGKVYIGQTLDAPERRHMQHRSDHTGPFKNGATHISWRVIPVREEVLDERESYYIGLYDACNNGYNENQGNVRQAYDRGCADRRAGKLPRKSARGVSASGMTGIPD